MLAAGYLVCVVGATPRVRVDGRGSSSPLDRTEGGLPTARRLFMDRYNASPGAHSHIVNMLSD